MTIEAKICGLSTAETLHAALQAGADYVGFVFFPKSPRHVAIETAAELAEQARGRAKIVALVVNAPDETIDEIVSRVAPDILQLHGTETPQRVAEVKAKFGLPVIKAIAVSSAADAAHAISYTDVADLILFDAKAPATSDVPGGHGKPFDWTVLQPLAGKFRFMLGGGLNPDNVAEAIRITGAAAVDVSSGVESRPGIKDTERVGRFLHAAKAANQA